MLRLLTLSVVSCALLLTGCSGDDSIAAFCDGSENLQDVEPGSEESRGVLREILADAPEEIKDELQTFSDVNDKIAEGGTDLTEDDISALETANEKITGFEEENC